MYSAISASGARLDISSWPTLLISLSGVRVQSIKDLWLALCIVSNSVWQALSGPGGAEEQVKHHGSNHIYFAE